MGCAVVVVRHLNKGQGGHALYRGGGSIGIVGAARAAFVVAKDPDDEGKRVLAPVKCNLSAAPPSRDFRLVEGLAGVTIEWLGESGHSASALLAAPTGDTERGAFEEATALLRDSLGSGPRSPVEVRKEAREAGISERTLDRAKAHLRVKSLKSGFGGPWRWCLPCDQCSKDAKGARSTPSQGVASFGDSWRPSVPEALDEGEL